MNRFAGKFSFYFNDYKLIFFDSRVGLVHKTKHKFKLYHGAEVPLPPEASVFFAYERLEGYAVLQAFNGEVVAFGGHIAEEILPSTTPTGNPRMPVPYYTAHFDLAPFRAARADGTWKTKLVFKRPDSYYKGLAFITVRGLHPRDLDGYTSDIGLTNITGSQPRKEPAIFTLVQHADGLSEITSGKKEVEYFDFRAAGKGRVDLSGEDLSGVKFGYSDFSGAKLKGTKFNRAAFERAGFTNADLDGADFTGATLKAVDFSHARLHNTVLESVTGESCNFSHCDLRTAVSSTPLALESPEGAPTKFSHAKIGFALLGAKWADRHLDYLSLEGRPDTMSGLDAQNAVLTGMHLGRLTAPNANFNGARLQAVGFTHAKLVGAKFEGARLESVSLPDGSALAAADFTGADLRGASFRNANVSGVSFSGTTLQEGVFEAATVRGTNFANAYMKSVNFSAVEQKLMHGVNFSRAFLVGCNFQGADLSTDVQLVQAYLHGTDFSSAQFGNANLAGAGISTEAGELTVKLGDRPAGEVKYDPTVIDPEVATSRTTRCPSGDLGPCTGHKLDPPRPFPKSWPWPASVRWPNEEEDEPLPPHQPE